MSQELIDRARRGDRDAREQLVDRTWRALRGFAHRRLPDRLRGTHDTADLLQSAFARAWQAFDRFEPRGPAAFIAFVRRILLNRVRDLSRGARATRPHEPPPKHLADAGPGPLDEAAGSEVLRAYAGELDRLTPQQRSATILRFELGWSFERIAADLGMPSANAARMCVMRGAARLRRSLRVFVTPSADSASEQPPRGGS